MKNVACFALILAMSGTSALAQETGVMTGRLIDEHDQQIRVGHAAVFICDTVTGRPFIKNTYQLLGTGGATVKEFTDLAHAVTDHHGRFEFKGVPAGKYRLVAQSWLGFAGVPTREDPSEFIRLHGVSDHLELESGEELDTFIRPVGNAMMTLVADPEAPHNYLVLSTSPMRGDPVLGFPFWGENFANHAIGVTVMETHKVTFYGLPEGDLHVGLFNYDNSIGMGGTTFKMVDGGTARVPIYAMWSDKYDPPERLLPLVEYLEARNATLEKLLKVRYPEEFTTPPPVNSWDSTYTVLLKHGDEKITLEEFGEVRLLDLAAADTYRRLRQYHKKK